MANNESQYRGDELTVSPLALVSASTIAGKLVQSGDACLFGDIPGVAMTSAFAAGTYEGNPAQTNLGGVPATDVIALKVKGVFYFTVHPAAAVAPGKRLYIDPATGIISDDSTKKPFGWYTPTTLNQLNAGVDNVGVLVKLG